jgi:hypothetical protein
MFLLFNNLKKIVYDWAKHLNFMYVLSTAAGAGIAQSV